jgi:hypothetical protein
MIFPRRWTRKTTICRSNWRTEGRGGKTGEQGRTAAPLRLISFTSPSPIGFASSLKMPFLPPIAR